MKPIHLLAATLAVAPLSHAASIVWTAASFTNVNQISTNGTLEVAANLNGSAQTFNGVTFAAGGNDAANRFSEGTATFTGSTVGDSGANSIIGMTAAQFDNVFDSQMYRPGVGNNTITLTGLTPSTTYIFEYYAVDNRSAGWVLAVGDASGDYLTGISLDSPKILTGTFTADATTQVLRIRHNYPSDNNVGIEMYQLRSVPEPAMTLLGSLGLLALLRRRR